VTHTLIEVLSPLALIAVGLAYARRSVSLARRGQPLPEWRQVCFAVGLLAVLAADLPPLADVAEELVVAHMAQHLLIGDVAALLIVLGLNGPLLQPLLRRHVDAAPRPAAEACMVRQRCEADLSARRPPLRRRPRQRPRVGRSRRFIPTMRRARPSGGSHRSPTRAPPAS